MLKRFSIGIGLLILSGSLFLFSPMLGSAKNTSLPVLNTKAKNIAVFKNGLGFFVREGTVSLIDGWAVTEYVPNASLGSLWITSFDKDTILEEVIGYKEDIRRSFEAISIEELLASNIGKKVKVAYGDKIIEGTIKSVPEGVGVGRGAQFEETEHESIGRTGRKGVCDQTGAWRYHSGLH